MESGNVECASIPIGRTDGMLEFLIRIDQRVGKFSLLLKGHAVVPICSTRASSLKQRSDRFSRGDRADRAKISTVSLTVENFRNYVPRAILTESVSLSARRLIFRRYRS